MTTIHRIFCSFILICSSFVAVYAQIARTADFKERYELKEVLVLSRHNIRSPLSGGESLLGKITPHSWFRWTSAPSELSLRGGMLETSMGQYFRKWLVEEGLFTENAQPTTDEVNIYANSMQRTIATARYFTAGFMPVADFSINHRYSPSKMDPVFAPVLTNIDTAFIIQAQKEIVQMIGSPRITRTSLQLNEAYQTTADVLDWTDSPLYKSNQHMDFDDNNKVLLENGKEPAIQGSLKTATAASDALILQYYESNDEAEAAFQHTLTTKDWENIGKIKDVYTDILFTAPTIARNVAHPLLVYIFDELSSVNRKFTFLCGHDSNIASVAAALEVESYNLPATLEKKTPIGCKLVFEKWTNRAGEEFISINMVYQSTQQLRTMELLDLSNPPMIYPLHLQGMHRNSDGLYPFSEIQGRFTEAITSYYNRQQTNKTCVY